MFPCCHPSESALFRETAIRAMNRVVAGISIPVIIFYDCVPLRLCSLEYDTGKTAAIIECKRFEVLHAGRYRDVGKTGAITERMLFGALHAVPDNDTFKIFAVAERTLSNFRHIVPDNDTFKIFAAVADLPMLVTLSGIVTLVRSSHSSNVKSAMLVTLPSSGMTLALQPAINLLLSVSIRQLPAL